MSLTYPTYVFWEVFLKQKNNIINSSSIKINKFYRPIDTLSYVLSELCLLHLSSLWTHIYCYDNNKGKTFMRLQFTR